MKDIQTLQGKLRQVISFFKTPERLYMLLALSFGLLFVAIVPPFYNADESNHILRAYQITEGNLFADPVPGGIGGEVPTSFVTTINKADISRLFQQKEVRSVGLDEANYLSIRLNNNQTTPIPFPNTSIYSPMVYTPFLPVIEILKWFNSPPILMLYLGRIAGLLVATALVFLAIRTIPFGKWAIVAIGLIPMTIASFAAVSADGITIGLCLLATAYAIKLAYQNQQLDRAQLIKLGILLAGVGLSKTTYILFIALALLIPLINKYAQTKPALLKIGAVMAGAGLIGVIWQLLTGYIKNINSDPTVVPTAQLDGIIQHPLGFLAGPFQTTLLSNQHNGIVESTYGFFASLTTPLPYAYVLLSSFAVLFSFLGVAATRRRKPDFALPGLWPRMLMTAIAVGTVGLMSVALYVYWTPVGAPVIAGLQGRYFIPILVLGVLLLRTDKVVVDETFQKRLILGLSATVLVVSVIVCATKFYVSPV